MSLYQYSNQAHNSNEPLQYQKNPTMARSFTLYTTYSCTSAEIWATEWHQSVEARTTVVRVATATALPTTMLLLVVLLLVAAVAGANTGLHPRLLFGPEDLPALRARVGRPPFSAMLQQLLVPPDNATDPYDQATAVLRDAAIGILTDNATACERSLQGTWAIVNSSGLWANTSAEGLTRAFFSRSVALAYDLCFTYWPANDTQALSTQLIANGYSLMYQFDLVNGLGNNHLAVRYSSAGLCFAACDNQPDCSERGYNAYTYLTGSLLANLGRPALGTLRNGWNPEGQGYTSYPAVFTFPFAEAASRLWGVDLRDDVPPVATTLVTLYISSIPIEHIYQADSPRIVRGLHPDFVDDNPVVTLSGSLSMAFRWAPAPLLPALRWIYDNSWGAQGDTTYDSFWAGSLFGILYYPEDTSPMDPAITPLGLTYTDLTYGVASFRNSWTAQDQAILVQVNAHNRRCYQCHAAADIASLRIMGLGTAFTTGAGRTGAPQGQTAVFGALPESFVAGDLSVGSIVAGPWFQNETGDGSVSVAGSCLNVSDAVRRVAVSYNSSALGGAAAAIVVADSGTLGSAQYWRLNTPSFNTLRLEESSNSSVAFLITSPSGSTMRGLVLYAGTDSDSPTNPQPVNARTGTVRRDDPTDPHSIGYPFGSAIYLNNSWVDVAPARPTLADGFVVVMTLAPAGVAHPQVRVIDRGHGGCCGGRVIQVGELTFTVNSTIARVRNSE